MKLKVGTTHPIQYQIPWFRALTETSGIELEVGFAWLPTREAQGTGFGMPFSWNVPILEGYAWKELDRAGRHPDLAKFSALRLRHPIAWLNTDSAALIVTGWNSLALIQLALAARRRKMPVLVRGDSNAGRKRGLLQRVAHRLLLSRFTGFLVVGEGNRAFYRGYGVSPDRLFDCPHFVDNEYFAAASLTSRARRAEVRTRWGVDLDHVVALFVGKLIQEKNLEELLAAFQVASANEARLRLVLVGEGPLRLDLERRAAAAGIEATWVGFLNQSELPEAYAAADLLVLPSRSETWGLVINEAMASGLPVIASDRVGCAPDLVHPGRTGELYRSGHPEELAERLVLLAGNATYREEAGAAGQKLVHERYSVARAVEGTLAAVRRVTRAA